MNNLKPGATKAQPDQQQGMKAQLRKAIPAMLALFTLNAAAVTRYVDLNSPSPTPPYTNWPTAATNIQDAIDAASAGDQVLVTNGVYRNGGRAVYGTTNRIALTKPVSVWSANGPDVTIIEGYQQPGTITGPSAIRCAYLTNGASLVGFTLTNGAAAAGGGAWSESTGPVLSNCVFIANFASVDGGGAMNGTVQNSKFIANRASSDGGGAYNCIISGCFFTNNSAVHGGGVASCNATRCDLVGNKAMYGGGSSYGTINNCNFVKNRAYDSGGGAANSQLNNCAMNRNVAEFQGGGAYWATLKNCTVYNNRAGYSGGGTYLGEIMNSIIFRNTAVLGSNFDAGNFYYCFTDPVPLGVGNTNRNPQLASMTHLSVQSPCRGAGSGSYVTGTDIDGEIWLSPPSSGCDEYRFAAITGAVAIAIVVVHTNVVAGFPVTFTAEIEGRLSGSYWDFGDGTIISNQPLASHVWTNTGSYQVTLWAFNDSHPSGTNASVSVQVVPPQTHFVLAGGTNPIPPYSSWATAATTIQDAVDAASTAGNTILVGPGVYAVGSRVVEGIGGCRVAVTKPLIVRSTDGSATTVIQGYQVPGTTTGIDALRCVYLTDFAVLAGFTLTNGATKGTNFITLQEMKGGGVYCESSLAVVSNSVVVGNASLSYGGGTYSGSFYNCVLKNNTSGSGAGSHGSVLNWCAISNNVAAVEGGGVGAGKLYKCEVRDNKAISGGGVYQGQIRNTSIVSNTASAYGGGAYNCTIENALIFGNQAASSGGGVRDCVLYNSTVSHNSAVNGGGGAVSSELTNCIVFYNSGNSGPNFSASTLSFCCTTPNPGGLGNITNTPAFLDALAWNYRLRTNSPCINSGTNKYAAGSFDLDGRPRIVGGKVDIGAYESQGADMGEFIGWLEQMGLPTDGSVDFTDNDDDGHNNWQEWRADTIPTNALSVLRMVTATNATSGLNVTWQSVSTRNYWLERVTNFSVVPPFQSVATNIPGTSGTKTYTDTSATNGGPYFYRVGVQ